MHHLQHQLPTSLGCVLIAGIYGGLTASKKIIYIQAVPALIALVAVNFL